jgi:hypothetical protein
MRNTIRKECDMNKTSHDAPDRRRHRREKATIDYLVCRVFDPESREKQNHPSTTDSGAPIEEQVRKEWDPRKGGLPVF